MDAGHVGQGDNVAPPPRHPLDKGYRAHNTNVYPQRPDRLYLCYIDGGMFVMDIADKASPKVISHWTNSPPYTGFMHTAVPLFDRNLMLVTDESTENNAADWPKLIWVLDARDETHPVPISTCPMPPVDAFKDRGGRFGAHNIHENMPLPTCLAVRPDRARHLLQRRLARLRHLQPVPAEGSRAPSCRRRPKARRPARSSSTTCSSTSAQIVYTVDRHTGGLYILEMDFCHRARAILRGARSLQDRGIVPG